MADILYAAPLSLYSGKARAYMDWKGIDYREELATPEVQKHVIIPGVGRPVMPVVKTASGEIVQDTTLIIDHYENNIDGPSVYPETPVQNLAALLLETYGDEWLLIPAMHYRWQYNEEWVYGEFGKVVLPNASAEDQHAEGKKHGSAFKGFCGPLGITPDTIPAIEKAYEEVLTDLDAHFGEHDYLFGARPSIGDYGLIAPLYAHLYRDPKSGELMERIAPRVAKWVRRMVNVEKPLLGEFLAGDEVPDTLLPVLKRMMAEQIPHLQIVANMLKDWSDGQETGAEIPRAIGMADFTMEGVTGQRIAIPFSLWMLQRALDYYAGLEGADKQAADALIDAIGGAAFTDFQLPKRVDFVNFKTLLAA